MVKYSTSILASANLLALAQAFPAQPVCSVVVQVVTGKGFWVPQPEPTWSEWSADPSSTSSKPKTPDASTKTEWSTWVEPTSTSKVPDAKTTNVADPWSNWDEAFSSSTTTTKKGGQFYPSSTTTSAHVKPTTTDAPKPTTTSKEHKTTTTTKSSSSISSTTTTTTTQAPKPSATCPAYDEKYSKVENVSGGGSCGSTYTVNCGARVNVPQDGSVKFWERNAGELINSLAECIAICDENSKCNAVIWTDYAGAGSYDLKHCWQTDNLPQPSLFGGANQYGQIAYKNGGSGSCASGYINQGPH